MSAHNVHHVIHQQVTRKWMNLEGEQVVEHLAEQLAAMESLMEDAAPALPSLT